MNPKAPHRLDQTFRGPDVRRRKRAREERGERCCSVLASLELDSGGAGAGLQAMSRDMCSSTA
jgi:hypothetical protein